ncbi:MAG: 3-deoxy-manno-octulosonate cytidylyltransferase [Bdellovibrionota bacterium]|jgi:3-deoxy-manno-octulosonate cytidylyltransferase (CMP-KDO synthetase)
MRTAIIIPARYGSKRFPGKPLVPICGVPLLERVINIANRAKADEVCVATDDERIFQFVAKIGVEVVMTDPACSNGTERVLEAAKKLVIKPDAVINLQGDAVLTPPWILDALIDEMQTGTSVATPAVRLSRQQLTDLQEAKAAGNSSGTLVVFDRKHCALYFSRSVIPFERSIDDAETSPVFRHIGLYAYTLEALEEYMTLPVGRLEELEKLEQLRWIEAGISLKVVEVDYCGRTHCAVDTPQDAKKAEEIILREGELC